VIEVSLVMQKLVRVCTCKVDESWC